MRFDMTVSIGNVIQLGGMVVVIVAAYYKLREQIIAIDVKLGPLWSEYTERRHVQRRAEDRE